MDPLLPAGVAVGDHSVVKVIAHRANVDGPSPAAENSLAAIRSCLERGWSVETDIRRDPAGEFYIAHDPAPVTRDNAAARFCALWREFPHVEIALNVKEVGYEAELLAFLTANGVIDQVVLFDMELVEPVRGGTARLFRTLCPRVRLAVRASDRAEPVEAAVRDTASGTVWLDEFDTLWVTDADAARLKGSGKRVYAISPELHGLAADPSARWRDFERWGFDGICTDFAAELDRRLAAARPQGAS
jgi:glycerophosphoryl diester phosphodiesterase